jgi:hypothetical protein
MSIEEEVALRHLRPEATQGRTMYPGHVLVDLAAVVDECRALRVELSRVRAVGPYLDRIRTIRLDVERRHDALEPDAHFARMVLVSQLQILDALLDNARLYAE